VAELASDASDTMKDATPQGLAQDLRYTTKPGAVYLIARSWTQATILARAFACDFDAGLAVKTVTLLGSDALIDWKQSSAGLHLIIPCKRPEGIPVGVQDRDLKCSAAEVSRSRCAGRGFRLGNGS
jgi:Alpha-L-fucosidase C-terminal domain